MLIREFSGLEHWHHAMRARDVPCLQSPQVLFGVDAEVESKGEWGTVGTKRSPMACEAGCDFEAHVRQLPSQRALAPGSRWANMLHETAHSQESETGLSLQGFLFMDWLGHITCQASFGKDQSSGSRTYELQLRESAETRDAAISTVA